MSPRYSSAYIPSGAPTSLRIKARVPHFPRPHFVGATLIYLQFLPFPPSFSWQNLACLPKCSPRPPYPLCDFTLSTLIIFLLHWHLVAPGQGHTVCSSISSVPGTMSGTWWILNTCWMNDCTFVLQSPFPPFLKKFYFEEGSGPRDMSPMSYFWALLLLPHTFMTPRKECRPLLRERAGERAKKVFTDVDPGPLSSWGGVIGHKVIGKHMQRDRSSKQILKNNNFTIYWAHTIFCRV